MDKPRPIVVMHRDFAGRALNECSSHANDDDPRHPDRGPPRPADGIDRDCVAMLDALTLLPKERFVRRIGLLGTDRMTELCDALAIALACGTSPGG